MPKTYLESVISQFEYYKQQGEKTFEQLKDEDLFWKENEASNSIANIVKHLWGNMMSRWTDFKTTDGEKEWRKRDEEFDSDIQSREEMMNKWDEGWKCLFNAINSVSEDDLQNTTIYIRNEGHFISEAINRQLAHYPFHVGQIVFIGKLRSENWEALSIAKGDSKSYNQELFSRPKA